MLSQNNMIKKKYLPFYEEQQLNFYIRSRSNPEKIKEFYNESAVLRPVLHGGNLWTTIKNLFKKGKRIAKNTIDYIDSSPLLSTVKDIGFDIIKEKTGIDPNTYYDTTRNIINMSPTDTVKVVNSIADKTKQNVHDYLTRDKNKPYDYKQTLKSYYDDIVKNVPQYQPQVKTNYDLFSLGSELAGSNKTILNNIPKLLMVSKSNRGGYVINKDFKPLLNKYGIKSMIIPKTLKEFIAKMEKSKGRLYLGHGDTYTSQGQESKGPLTIANNIASPIKEPRSNGKNKINRYNEILNKLKK